MPAMYRLIAADTDADSIDDVTRWYGWGDEAGVRHYPSAYGTLVGSRAQAHAVRAELIRRWKEEVGDDEVPRYRIVAEG